MLLHNLPSRPYRKGKTTMTGLNFRPMVHRTYSKRYLKIVPPCPICNTRTCDSTNQHSDALLAGIRTTDHRTSFANPYYCDPIGK